MRQPAVRTSSHATRSLISAVEARQCTVGCWTGGEIVSAAVLTGEGVKKLQVCRPPDPNLFASHVAPFDGGADGGNISGKEVRCREVSSMCLVLTVRWTIIL